MPVARIPIDGLWRCLCPSFDAFVLPQPPRILNNASQRARVNSKKLLPRRARAFCTTPSLTQPVEEPLRKSPEQSKLWSSKKFASEDYKWKPIETEPLPVKPGYTHSYLSPKPAKTEPTFNKAEADTLELDRLDGETIGMLHDRLRTLTEKRGAYRDIVQLVEYLVTVRGEKAGLVHYDALVRANADASFGSAVVVKGLIDQMKVEGVVGDSGFYHGVLQALAIHPDYILRSEIMDQMKDRWYGLSPYGWHNLAVGLLRDNQIEVAMDKLEQMHMDQIVIKPWLYDMFVFKLCEWDELDEALKIIRYRWETLGEDIPPTIWYYVLEKFATALHYEGIKYVWRARIESRHMNPSDGICLAILNLAARHRDPRLATKALRILSTRKTTLASFHYEALLEAYVTGGDMQTAFRILSIMSKAGLEPDANSTRSIFRHLTDFQFRDQFTNKRDMSDRQVPEAKALPQEAWKILESMHEARHDVPIAAVNVILEALCNEDRHVEALERYKQVHNFCKANTETFNTLLKRLSAEDGRMMTHAKHTAMFLAAEMHALGVKPDVLTYDRLVIVCSMEVDYEDAFRYWEEMKIAGINRTGKEWLLRQGTLKVLMKRCAVAGDKRAWDIVKQLGERGLDTKPLVHQVETMWKVRATTLDAGEWPLLTANVASLG